MAKGRKDPKGRVLRKGESYRPQDNRYRYSYTDPFGRRKSIYDKDLAKLREKEDQLKKDQLVEMKVIKMLISDVSDGNKYSRSHWECSYSRQSSWQMLLLAEKEQGRN